MKANPEEKPGLTPDQTRRRQTAVLWLLGVLGGAMAVTGIAAMKVKSGWLWTVSGYLAWSALAVLNHFLFFRFESLDQRKAAMANAANEPSPHKPMLPWFQRKGQPLCLVGGGLVVLWLMRQGWRMAAPLPGSDLAMVRLAGSLLLGTSFILYFMGRYVTAVESQQDTRTLNAPLHLARLGFWICLLSAACLFTLLYARRDCGWWVGRAVGVVTVLLVIEVWVRAGLAAFQPRALLAELPPLGGSLVLEVLFSRANPLEALIGHVESSFGVKMEHGWMVQFLRQTIEPVTLVGMILVWLSTSITAVPPQSHGVRARWGRYLSPALEPGLYFTWPWPVENIEIVPTERIRQITLGFEQDLGGAALWTERHYEGEQNLLVGNGEEMLSISVPIYYRIRDALAYLQTTTDAQQALSSLAYRQLLAVTEARDSFGVMTIERQAISQALKQSLQQEVDRMHLGLDIVFVGLKDIHPPVAVAPAYQAVVSAEEAKLAYVLNADAYQIQTLGESAQQANRLRTEADALLKQRTALAQGETAGFVTLATEDAANTNLFRFRLRLEALEKALSQTHKVVLTGAATTNQDFYFDIRNLTGPTPP